MSDPSHHCSALVITCMDWRLHPAVTRALADHIPGPFDVVAVPGAARALGDPPHESVREFLLSCVEVSTRLHGVARVVLVHHTDCGAYGGAAAFDGEDHEAATHRRDMAEATRVITGRFPDVTVEHVVARVRPDQEGWSVAIGVPRTPTGTEGPG